MKKDLKDLYRPRREPKEQPKNGDPKRKLSAAQRKERAEQSKRDREKAAAAKRKAESASKPEPKNGQEGKG